MKKIALALFLGFTALLPLMPKAHADSIVGILRMTPSSQDGVVEIEIASDKSPLGTTEKKVYRVESRGNVYVDIRRLKTGDFIAGQGTLDQANGIAVIESIDKIGLQQLLGAWRSITWEIFEFSDFQNLNLYIPRLQQGNISFSKTRTLTYVVTPRENDGFSIFLTDNNNVRMGYLAIQKGQVSLSITDFNTGKVTQEISLLPLNLK